MSRTVKAPVVGNFKSPAGAGSGLPVRPVLDLALAEPPEGLAGAGSGLPVRPVLELALAGQSSTVVAGCARRRGLGITGASGSRARAGGRVVDGSEGHEKKAENSQKTTNKQKYIMVANYTFAFAVAAGRSQARR